MVEEQGTTSLKSVEHRPRNHVIAWDLWISFTWGRVTALILQMGKLRLQEVK